MQRDSTMPRSQVSLALWLGLAASLTGCGASEDATDDGESVSVASSDLSGCHGKASHDIPASGSYVLTTFGTGAESVGRMSCGQTTRNGSWYYAASRQRYGCGAHLRV